MRKFTLVLTLLLLVGLQAVLAQTRVINGVVSSSEDKSPIPGVTIVVKGTTIGTTTNVDGKYVISVPGKYDALVFSFVGMKTKEIKLGESSVIDVVLEPDVMNMDEIVVTAIGIPRESKALSYSVQAVGSEEISKSAQGDVIGSLQGRVSDVMVIQSAGTAGAGSYISIRGVQSITGDNQPLFVVDGVPIDNSGGTYGDVISGQGVDGVATSNRAIDINPDDVESMNVLKGGAATALYGLRAASGAIIITTKKGKAGTGKKINVNFNSSVTFDKISQMPQLQKEFAQGSYGQWSSGNRITWGPKIDTCTYDNTYTGPPAGTPPSSANFWPLYDVDGAILSKNAKTYNPTTNPTGADVNVYDPYDFFQTGITTNNSIALTGGNDITTFYFSFSDNQSKGVVPNNWFRRNTFKLSGDTKLSDKWKISGNANYIITDANRVQQGSNTSGVMLGLLRTPPTFDNSAGYIIYGSPYYADGKQRSYRHGGGYDNPYWTANMNHYKDKTNRLIGDVGINYFANKWLSFSYRIGVDWWGRKVYDEIAIGSATAPSGRLIETMETNKDFNSDLIMTIDKDFAKDFNLHFLLGNNVSQLFYTNLQGTANGLLFKNYYNMNNTESQSASESTREIRRAGFYGDLQLSWRSMLYLSITGRNDWSTTLPEANNSFFYPSFGLGWIFTQLGPLKDNKVLPYGKVRVSYAIVAKDASPYYTSTTYNQYTIADGWTSGDPFPFNNTSGYTWGPGLGNEKLKPEKTKSFEVGADLKFWKNRISLSYTYFNNKGEDLLLNAPIAASSGYSTMYTNAASMRTQGNELTFEITPIKSKNWEWDITINYSRIRNEVLALAPGINSLFLGGFESCQIRAEVGQPYRTIYGTDWQRDANGNVLIDDNGYPIAGTDLIPLGNVDPDWTMGAGSMLRWKDLSFSFLVDVKHGGKMWNGTRGAIQYFGTAAETLDRNDWYVYEGVVKSTGEWNTKQVVKDQDWVVNNVGNGFSGPVFDDIENSGWVRLRTITLSYSFTHMLNKTFIKGLEVYFTGTNLLLFTHYRGVDPETSLLGNSNAQGIDYFNMPGTKGYTVGLTLAL
jgi:TonB-linked SusC/RagA family outer membrane protein